MRNLFLALLVVLTSCNDSVKDGHQASNENKKELEVVSLTSPTDSVSHEPYLFTDKSETVYLSWIKKYKDSAALQFSKMTDEQWSAPVTLASGINWFINWADYPMIVTDASGNMLAHFLEKSD